MILEGKLFLESPLYRGNARKTLFTRDGDGTQRLVSLAGEVSGTAESLMDAFIGRSRNGRNIGLLDKLWFRLYGSSLPEGLISRVECELRKECYPKEHFFDLRMGIKLDEDRWAAEANANYKMETLFRNSVFNFTMYVNDQPLNQGENMSRLYYLLGELKEGRFWFGAGKSKGLGRCRLELNESLPAPKDIPRINPGANHLLISLSFDTQNPVLVGWNWGKIEPDAPAFAAVDGRLLLSGMRTLPDTIRERLALAIGGPILNPENWKGKLSNYLPRVIAIWLKELSVKEVESLMLPLSALSKLSKGKHPIARKILEQLEPLCDKPFSSEEAAKEAITEAMGKKANLANRVFEHLTRESKELCQFDDEMWLAAANSLGIDPALAESLREQLQDEDGLVGILRLGCKKILPGLYEQVDRQIKLLASDAWIEQEIANREDHIKIKGMLLNGEISERDWEQANFVPKGISVSSFKEFVSAHVRVRFQHLTSSRNLRKSIVNDRNQVTFLTSYRDRTRQELTCDHNTDFRAGGPSNREISRKYGKPYDNIFMRMLVFKPSSEDGVWEAYIPGSTIKGAFRKRASQVLKTIFGETSRTRDILDCLFGKERQRGLIFFSDAYLKRPEAAANSWCAMDGVRMDPKTGGPVEEAKSDYLFACGQDLSFDLRIDLQDIMDQDMEALSVLAHLIEDFKRGDIPIGGEKTSGFGWVKAEMTEVNWMTGRPDGISGKLFKEESLKQDGIWHTLKIKGDSNLPFARPLIPSGKLSGTAPPRAREGFISHRAFGGYCGILSVAGETLSPISIQESGQPSFGTTLAGEPVNGWDFFSIASPEVSMRGPEKTYALPGKSVKGMLRHIYAIVSDSSRPSPKIDSLNPVDSLFGWVGRGPNQAIMGRLSFNFATFKDPELAWFKVPYPYGNWQFVNGEWKQVAEAKSSILRLGQEWRIFPHTPLAPIVKRLVDFSPDIVQAGYTRCIQPDCHCRFKIRFWNLSAEELGRLLWSLLLEEGLAHKMGKNRYLGFGSLRFDLLPDSYFIDWEARYQGKSEDSWRLPIKVEDWINTDIIAHYQELKEALNAKSV
ncbi:hypothetical protein KJ693_04180 [bacterium]|nr:hypothetical protein [bacterium]MBU1614491.1 hypothetical protein [bacterium]